MKEVYFAHTRSYIRIYIVGIIFELESHAMNNSECAVFTLSEYCYYKRILHAFVNN